MRNINKVILVGNVSRDPQSKTVGQGDDVTVTTFGVATHRYFTTKSGEKKSVTEFHNVVTWGPLAKRCADILSKGKLVYIEGYLKTQAFDLEGGQKSYRTEIVAHNMIILSKKEDAPNFGEDNDSEETLAGEEVLENTSPESPEKTSKKEEVKAEDSLSEDDNTF